MGRSSWGTDWTTEVANLRQGPEQGSLTDRGFLYSVAELDSSSNSGRLSEGSICCGHASA